MKAALITGGSRGIGKAIGLELAKKHNYHILINYVSNQTAAEETKKEIEELGGTADLLQYNVADQKATDNAIQNWLDDNEGSVIEVLVNNAGIRKDNLMVFMDNDEWDSVLHTHLNGFFFTTKAVLQQMIRNKYGRIINIVSLSGIKGMAGQTNYSAAKAGVIGATKALAQEIGRKNITVNAVAPGFIKTDMTEDIDEGNFKTVIPLRRFGKPEEVAGLVGFLASDSASYITGEVISVNGGLYT